MVEYIFAWTPMLIAPHCHLCSLCVGSLSKEPFRLLPGSYLLSSCLTWWRDEFSKCAFLLIHTLLSVSPKYEMAVILPTHPIGRPELMSWSVTHMPSQKSCSPSSWTTPYLCQEVPHKFLGTLILFDQAPPEPRTAHKGQDGCFLLVIQHFQAPTAEQVPPDKHLHKIVPAPNHL